MEEALFKIKSFKKPQSVEEANAQLGVTCDAIERCQKMMQHLAASTMTQGSGSSEISELMSQHMELLRIKNDLTAISHDLTNSHALTSGRGKPNSNEIQMDTSSTLSQELFRFFRKLLHRK